MKKLTKIFAASLLISCLAGCNNGTEETPVTYSVTYNGNGSTSGEVPVDSTAYKANEKATVKANESLEKEDYEFVNWNTTADGSGNSYVANDKFTVTADTVLYAQWNKVKFEVTYDGNGADVGKVPVDNARYTVGQNATVLGSDSLAFTDHDFLGWNTKADGSGDDYEVGENLEISGDITLYAQWEGKYWHVKTNDFLKKYGATAPLENMASWLEEDGVEVLWEADSEEGYASIYAAAYENEEVVTNVFEDDFLEEILYSENWACMALDESGYSMGYLSGIFYAKPNSETNNYAVMEFQYVAAGSFAALFFGYDPGLTCYFYVEEGYNAEDATNLLVTGMPELGLDADVLVNGASLASIADSFIVDADVVDPTDELMETMVADYNEILYAEISEGMLAVYFESSESDCLTDTENILGLEEFTISGTWEPVELDGGYSANMTTFNKGSDYEANVIVAQNYGTQYVILMDITCLNSSLFTIEAFDIIAFGYDVADDAEQTFGQMINTEDFVVYNQYLETFGVIACSKETVGEDNVIQINCLNDGFGNFIISVAPNGKPVTSYPVNEIKALYSDEFTTAIPTFDFDLAWSTINLEEGYVALVTLDSVANPTEENPSVLQQIDAEMQKLSSSWDASIVEDYDGTYYVYTSKEVNASYEQMVVIAYEENYQVVVEYAVKIAPKPWSLIADTIADFIEELGFISTTLVAGAEENIWNISVEYDEYDGSRLTISTPDDGTMFEAYTALIMADTTNWIVDESTVYDGTEQISAQSVETADGKKIQLDISLWYDGNLYIEMYTFSLPKHLDVDGINTLCATFGFENVLDEGAKEFLTDPAYSEFDDYGEEGFFLYEFIQLSNNPYIYLAEYFSSQDYDIDDSNADWGYLYFEKVVGDYDIYIMISDWGDEESCELGITVSLL